MLGKFYLDKIYTPSGILLRKNALKGERGLLCLRLHKDAKKFTLLQLHDIINEKLKPHGFRLSKYYPSLLSTFPPTRYFTKKMDSYERSIYTIEIDDLSLSLDSELKSLGLSEMLWIPVTKI